MCLLVVSVTIVGVRPIPGANDPWPYFGQNLRNNGRSPYDTSHVDGTVKWNYTLDPAYGIRNALSHPVVDRSGNLYINSELKALAFDPEGNLIWNVSLFTMISTAPALGPDGTIYIGGDNQLLHALNPRDGSVRWTFDAGSKIVSHPVVTSRNVIYFGTSDGEFFALDGLSRTPLWTFSVDLPDEPFLHGRITTPAIADDGRIYIGSNSGHFYALNSDGTLYWERFLGEEGIVSSPSIADDGTIYLGFIDGLYAFNPNDGSVKWVYQVMDRHGSLYGVWGTPAIGKDGTIYFGAADNSTYALYPDGRFKWNLMTDSHIHFSSPAIGADGTIYIGSYDTVFYAINPDRSIKWYNITTGAINSSPAIGADGTVYVGNVRGSVYAFTGEKAEVDINWYVIGGLVGIVAGVSLVYVIGKRRKES